MSAARYSHQSRYFNLKECFLLYCYIARLHDRLLWRHTVYRRAERAIRCWLAHPISSHRQALLLATTYETGHAPEPCVVVEDLHIS